VKNLAKVLGHRQNLKFLEVTTDGSFVMVTWAVDKLRGDAVLCRDRDYWQLMKITPGTFGLEDFERVNIPQDVARRILKQHHQKLANR
jgi:hypothetical protein